MDKIKIDDHTRIGLASDIADYILVEKAQNYLIFEDNPNDDGTQYTELGQDLFNSIYDTIEDIIMKYFDWWCDGVVVK